MMVVTKGEHAVARPHQDAAAVLLDVFGGITWIIRFPNLTN